MSFMLYFFLFFYAFTTFGIMGEMWLLHSCMYSLLMVKENKKYLFMLFAFNGGYGESRLCKFASDKL